jgi:hypothetical protein
MLDHTAAAAAAADPVAAPWTPRHPTLTPDEITAMVDAAMPGAHYGEKAAIAAFMTITSKRETAEAILADAAAKRTSKRRAA